MVHGAAIGYDWVTMHHCTVFRAFTSIMPSFRPFFPVFSLFLLLTLSACSTISSIFSDEATGTSSAIRGEDEEHADWTAAQFYAEAKEKLKSGYYEKAIKLYERLEARYPFGIYATQAQMDIAYAYYKNNEPESALAAVERFIKLNPTHPHADYAHYLRGLINYDRGIGFVDRWLPTDSSQRDPGPARDALRDFKELVSRFPNSKYAEDARQRIIALRNNIAMYEIHVARLYMKRGAYLAAARRCAEVIEHHERTQAVPAALQIMEEAYRKLELNRMADDVKRVHDINFAEGRLNIDDQYQRTVIEEVWDFVGFDR